MPRCWLPSERKPPMYSTNVSPSLLPSRPLHCGSVAPSAGSSRLFVQPPDPSVGFSKLKLLIAIGAACRPATPAMAIPSAARTRWRHGPDKATLGERVVGFIWADGVKEYSRTGKTFL